MEKIKKFKYTPEELAGIVANFNQIPVNSKWKVIHSKDESIYEFTIKD